MTETETVNASASAPVPIEDSVDIIQKEIGKATDRFDNFLTFAKLQKKNTKLKVSGFVSGMSSHRTHFRTKYAEEL